VNNAGVASRTLLVASLLGALLVVMIATVGVPGLAPVPPALTATVVGYAALFALVAAKTMLFRWGAPARSPLLIRPA
jgi:hypothetical protein